MKQVKPLVTIITIVYNLKESGREKYFRQCLKSVHDQTYRNFEHIIIDGASNDGSLDLIQEYSKKGWVKVYSEPDKGIYDALNKGLNRAKGEYIAFLHTDDYYNDTDAIKKSVGALLKSAADYSYADTRGINHETEEIVHLWKGRINQIPFGTHYCHQSMLVKTDVLKKIGGFSLKYRISSDSDMMTKLVARNYKPVYIPEAIVSYRSGGLSNSESGQTRKDHSLVFYNNLGKKYGISRKDCYLIWNFSLFNEKSFLHNLFFGLKLRKIGWIFEYYKKFLRVYFIKIIPKFMKKFLKQLLIRRKQ